MGHLRADRVLREVDDDVRALGRREREGRASVWPGHQAEVGADLDEVASGVEGQLEPTGVAGIEDAQPVAGCVDVGPRPGRTAHEHDVAEQTPVVAGVDDAVGHGIDELGVLAEAAVGDDEGQLTLIARQPQVLLGRVAQHECPGHAGVDVRTREVHRVVVVPERRRALVERVLVDPGGARPDEVRRVAVVLRRHDAAVQVVDDRDVELVGHGQVQRVALRRLDGGAREEAVVAGDLRRAPGQDLDSLAPHRHSRPAVTTRTKGGQPRQVRPEGPRQGDRAREEGPGGPSR